MRLAGVGAYAPRFRLSAEAVRDTLDRFRAPGIETVAVPDADEDAVTMAWEAARRALDAADVEAVDLDGLYLASTTVPAQDTSQVPHLATALGAPDTIDAREFTGSTAAGGEAFATALAGETGPDSAGPILVVASDKPDGEPGTPEAHAAGAGAAAVVLAPDGPGSVEGHGTATEPYPGTRFRPQDGGTQGLGITSYDRESYATVLETALDALSTDSLDAVAMTMPDGKLPYRAAGMVELDAETVAAAETVSTLGDTGAAGPLLGLASALADGASSVLLAAYGSGAICHAFRLEASAVPVEAALQGDIDLDYAAAMRRRGRFAGGDPAGGGANVPMPTFRWSLDNRYRPVAGACDACGELSFPAENACSACGLRDGYEDVELPREGRVVATTVIGAGGAPPEFVQQQERSGAYGTALVAFTDDEGRSVDIPLQVALADDEDPEIGDPVRTAFRVLYDQQGVRRYAAKAIALRSE